ncbi:MAG TPA: cell division protein FtsL [Nitrospirota bacterium]|nr:cell division protein FtsL [Nitrospirota bacterium]
MQEDVLSLTSSHLSSIRQRKRRLVKKYGAAFLVLCVVAFSMFYVWQRVQVVKLGYEIESLKKERDALVRKNKGLLIETATLTSPERVEEIATGNIGMRAPGDEQIVMVKPVKRNLAGPEPDPSRQVKSLKGAPGRS